MNEIDVHIDDEALYKLRGFMAIRQMTGNVVGPDYHVLALILLGLEREEYQVNITGATLDKLDKETR